MAYLSSIWAAANNAATEISLRGLYKYTNDSQDGAKLETGNSPWGILVSADRMNVYVTNQEDGTVSRYQNGERMVDINTQGATPYGVCEGVIPEKDGNYAVFVTNYSSNTVVKIVDDQVVDIFAVGRGPRGICCDPEGNIWVANYIDNDLSVIWKGKTLYDRTFPVASGPDGICSDSDGAIYVACSVSGLVTKYDNMIKVADINVGSMPRGICCDEDDNVWVANYNTKSVTRIHGADLSTTTYSVGRSPFSIGVVRQANSIDTDVVVFCYEDKLIQRLDKTSGTIIGQISTGYNPMGFGDFSGMQTYIVRSKYDSVMGPGGVSLVGWNDLTEELQNIILGNDSPNITVHASDVILEGHTKYPTVQAALDYLLYEAPSLSSNLVITSPINGYAEIGSAVSTVKFAWGVENPAYVTAQSLVCPSNSHATIGNIAPGITQITGQNLNVYTDDETGTTYNGLTSNTTWVLTITGSNGEQLTSSATLKFAPKYYFGTSATLVFTSDQILQLGGDAFVNEVGGTLMPISMEFNCTGGRYIVFALPSAYRINAGGDITIGGLINSDWDVKQNFKVTNASGYTNNYDVYTSKNIQTDEHIVVEINAKLGNSNTTDLPNSAGSQPKP